MFTCAAPRLLSEEGNKYPEHFSPAYFSCFIFHNLISTFSSSTHIFITRIYWEESKKKSKKWKNVENEMKEMRLKGFCNKEMYNRYARYRVESKVQAFFSKKKIDFKPKINYYSTFKRNFKSTITFDSFFLLLFNRSDKEENVVFTLLFFVFGFLNKYFVFPAQIALESKFKEACIDLL